VSTLVLLPACADDPGASEAGTDASETEASTTDAPTGDPAGAGTWTIFVYGHADHNLSPSLLADMIEMSNATLGDDINVIVMADWDASNPDYASGSEWYRIVGGEAEPELLESAPEQNLDDPAVLTASIERAFRDYPAEHYGVVMWNHGGAWMGGFGGDSADGTGHGPGISAAVLATSIRAALDAHAIDQLRFLAFDTCLMAGVEVVSELAPLTELYIANAEIDYGAGWDYTATLTWLGEHPDADAEELALAESEQWNAHHEVGGAEDALLRSHVSLDASAVAAFNEAFAAFTDALTSNAGMSGVALGRSAYFALPGYLSDSVGSLASTPNLRDVGQFLAAMQQSDDAALVDAAANASAALDAMIFATVNGDLRAPVGQSGVHIELPPALLVPERRDAYASLASAWVGATGWDRGLDLMLEVSDAQAPIVLTDVVTVPGRLVFATDDTDVAEADISVAAFHESDPDLVLVLGLVGTGVIDPGFEYEFAWDGSLLELGGPEGTQPVPVFPFARVGIQDGDGTPVLAIPGYVRVGGEQAEAALPFQATDTMVDSAVISTGIDTTAVLPLQYLVGNEFVPVVPALRVSTGEIEAVEGTPIVIPESGTLQLADGMAPGGDYMLITSVFDVWGNYEPVADLVTLP
jgi:hypothetical protein